MNIKKIFNRLYLSIKDINYLMFLLAYVVVCSVIVMIFDIFNTLFINSDLMVRFELGLPIILQLLLTYIVYRENKKIRIIKILYLVVFIYTLVCGIFSLYELYSTYPSFADDLFYYVSNAQIVFQFVLTLLLFICLVAKLVNKVVIIKPLLMASFTMIIIQFGNKVNDSDLASWIIIITLFINAFNPVLLYILCYTAKGKLLINTIGNMDFKNNLDKG